MSFLLYHDQLALVSATVIMVPHLHSVGSNGEQMKWLISKDKLKSLKWSMHSVCMFPVYVDRKTISCWGFGFFWNGMYNIPQYCFLAHNVRQYSTATWWTGQFRCFSCDQSASPTCADDKEHAQTLAYACAYRDLCCFLWACGARVWRLY